VQTLSAFRWLLAVGSGADGKGLLRGNGPADHIRG